MIAIIGAIVSALGFGSANIVIKKALEDVTIPVTLLMSTLSGGFLLFFLSFHNGVDENITINLLATMAGLALVEVLLYLILYKAFDAGNVTSAAAIIGVYPILSTFVAITFFGENLETFKFLFIIMMIVGALLTSIRWQDVFKDGFDKKDLVKGLPWIIAALIMHAIYFPLLGNVTSEGSWEEKLFLIKVFSAIILFVVFFIIRKEKITPPKNKFLFLSLLGFFEITGWAGLSWASNNSVGETAIIIAALNSSALVTAVLAYFFLKEKLSILQYFGVIVIVASLIGLSW